MKVLHHGDVLGFKIMPLKCFQSHGNDSWHNKKCKLISFSIFYRPLQRNFLCNIAELKLKPIWHVIYQRFAALRSAVELTRPNHQTINNKRVNDFISCF